MGYRNFLERLRGTEKASGEPVALCCRSRLVQKCPRLNRHYTGHIVAAFDVLDWPKPENIANTFAQLKNKRSGELFDKGEKINEWVLSQRGVNLLDRLGKDKAK